MSTVLAIGDLHFPFQHKDALKFVEAAYDVYMPDTVVQLGDLFDFHALSDYTSDPDGYSPGNEYQKALEVAEGFYLLFPQLKACWGNHDRRIWKKAFKAGLPQSMLKDWPQIVRSPKKWEWADDYSIDGVTYIHGDGYSGVNATREMLRSKMTSVVHGHLHANAGVIHMQLHNGKCIMGSNAGCLVDNESYAMAYAKYSRTAPSLGVTLAFDGVLQWLPMVLNKSGKKWNGKIY